MNIDHYGGDRPEPSIVLRMQSLINQWEAAADRRAIFLRCYMIMTGNMLIAIEQGEFADPIWVEGLLRHFADYYFAALKSYDQEPAAAPAVWQLAFGKSQDPGTQALQNLLLGVNAHINYDLVLTLTDVLGRMGLSR